MVTTTRSIRPGNCCSSYKSGGLSAMHSAIRIINRLLLILMLVSIFSSSVVVGLLLVRPTV